MNITLERTFEKSDSTTEFRNTLALFCGDSEKPYAMRAPLNAKIPSAEQDSFDIVSVGSGLTVAVRDNHIYCRFGIGNNYTAIISFTDNTDIRKAAHAVESRLNDAVDILRSNLKSTPHRLHLNSLIAQTATFCGCLTDIAMPEEDEAPLAIYSTPEGGSNYSAMIALCAICLLYRRISALRGFNFKLIFSEGIPSLAFSAKILGEGISSIKDIPEYFALADLDSRGSVTVYSRLIKLTPEEGEELYRLTLVLTLQSEDPQGLLRAPQWKEQTRKKIDELELDIPGRF